MISNPPKAIAATIAILLVAEAGTAAGQSSRWISELPTVDQVRQSYPAGKDAQDTALRQSAAFVVWQDVIEAFTKKSFFDLMGASRSAPEVKRYFEYSGASTIGNTQGHAVDGVLAYSNTADFRQEVLAKFLSPATLQAYWTLRRDDLAARQARHAAFVAPRTAAADSSARPQDRAVLPAIVERDLERATKAGVDTTVFGISLGKPLAIPDCSDAGSTRGPCLRKCTKTDFECNLQIVFPPGTLPEWADNWLFVDFDGSSAVGFQRNTIAGQADSQMRADLVTKYGKPKSTKSRKVSLAEDGMAGRVDDWEWFPPGLHVSFHAELITNDPARAVWNRFAGSSYNATFIVELDYWYAHKKEKESADKAADKAKRKQL